MSVPIGVIIAFCVVAAIAIPLAALLFFLAIALVRVTYDKAVRPIAANAPGWVARAREGVWHEVPPADHPDPPVAPKH
ncbi:MAG TPA: hypothetical protein VK015_01370 [Microbacterium sp.]|nr:hypothetical protein [Microbacterium sp.]